MTTDMTVADAMAALRARGITRVVVHFSGGNDEGGADSFTATDADGNEVELPTGRVYQDWQTKEWVVYSWADGGRQTRPATPDEINVAKVSAVLEQPVYDRYGGFAGEFYVDGTCTWDVTAGTFEMHGTEEHPSYESF